jgi:cytochrome P450
VIDYNPFSDEVMENPQPIYKRLRDEAPVYYLEKYDAWALSRFQDIWDCSSHKAFSAAQGTTPSQVLTKVQPVTPMLNLMDPPEHTKLRSAVRPRFSRQAMRGMEPTIRGIVSECLDKALPRGRCDVMADLASVVSVKVACMAVGIPIEDGDFLNDLVWRFFGREPGVDGMTEDGLAAAQELNAYFVDLVRARERSGNDDDDVVNAFRRFELGGRRFDEQEIGSHLSMLIIGGSETFPKTFANAINRLEEHPEQRARCERSPELIPDAYLEALRFDMPTQFLCRTLLEDVELHGQTLRKGSGVCFLYASANHDDREFENPDVFDIDRHPERILSFGAGTHACLGLFVAKLEGKVCLEETLRRIPSYRVDREAAVRLRTEFVQGFGALPITFDAA